MHYKVTRQYPTGSEDFFAEFYDIKDAQICIEKLLTLDDAKKLETIYRLFVDDKLLSVFTSTHSTSQTKHSQYADGESKLPATVENPFNVLIRDNFNGELIIANFSLLKDAEAFIEAKVATDADFDIDMTYCILDGERFIEKNNQAILRAKAQKKESKPRSMIRPSPLSYRLRPRGSAYGFYNKDDDEDDENKK